MAEGKTERHSARNMSREISCLRQIGQQRWIAVARWVDRQLQERYVTRLIKSAHKYRDPLSALQLKEIDDRFLLLRPGRLIVDFGCSPGGWTQVAVERCQNSSSLLPNVASIIAIDRVYMEPIGGVQFLLGVVGERLTLQRLVELLNGYKADVVLSDIVPKFVDDATKDHRRQSVASLAAAETAEEVLKPGGSFVCRISKSCDVQDFHLFLRSRFEKVSTHYCKHQIHPKFLSTPFDPPVEHNNSSQHLYLIGENFIGRQSLTSAVQVKGGFDPKEGHLGEATTDLLDPKDQKLRYL